MSRRRIEPFDPGRALIARKAFLFRGIQLKPGDPFPPEDPKDPQGPVECTDRRMRQLHNGRYVRHAGPVAEAALPAVTVDPTGDPQPPVIENAEGEPVVAPIDPQGATVIDSDTDIDVEGLMSPASPEAAPSSDEAPPEEASPEPEGGASEEPAVEPKAEPKPDQ